MPVGRPEAEQARYGINSAEAVSFSQNGFAQSLRFPAFLKKLTCMILAHAIVGAMPVGNSEFSWFWFIGSVIPDIDHPFVLYKHKIFSWNKVTDTMRFEDKYDLRYKTKYGHSIFGAVIMTLPVSFISTEGALYFFLAYLVHLVLDWPDRDEKQYFYPFKKKIRGFLPIFSKPEIVFTIALVGLLASLYKIS